MKPVDALRCAAEAAFAAGVTWHQAVAALGDAKQSVKRIERPRRVLKGCPSEAAYRRHLKAGEKCQSCRDYMRGIELQRRANHPEWWVRGAGRPVAP